MKKITVIVILIVILLTSSCIKQQGPEPEPKRPDQVRLSQIGTRGKLAQPQSAYEILEMTDFDLWVLYLKKDKLTQKIKPSNGYSAWFNGQQYQLKQNPFNANILKLLLPYHIKPQTPANMIIKTTDVRENGEMKNDIQLAIEKIYISKDPKNGTELNEISVVDYTNLYAEETSFAYENGAFLRPTHVKSNEENAYTVNTYFDARTAATTESATGAFQFLKDVDNYESYIIMENPNRFRETGGSTELLDPDDRWRIRQLGNRGELDGNNVFNIEDDPINQQFTLSIDTDTLPATYNGTIFWLSQFQEATQTQFDENGQANILEISIPYTDAPSTELVLNARFQGVENKILRFNENGEFQDSYSVLNTAVAEANNNDIIKIAGGTVVSPTNEHATMESQVLIFSKTLTFTSTNELPVILDAQQSFPILGASHATLILENLRFINGSGSMGGGLGLVNSTAHIQACEFASNTVNSSGGAIYAVDSTLSLENSTLTHNHSDSYGGGLYTVQSTLTLNNATVTNNKGGLGAGIYAEKSPLIINHSSFRSNENQLGGTVYISSDRPSTITHSTFKDNVAGQYAAGIYAAAPVANKGHLMIENCLFENNQLTTDQTDYPHGLGAGIWSEGLTRGSVIKDNVFKDMEARLGGGILDVMGKLTLYNNTFENLNVTETGAAIYTIMGRFFNSNGDEWQVFNSPAADVDFVENTTQNNNTYMNCTINFDATAEGAKISYMQQTTPQGTLTLSPTEALQGEATSISMDLETTGYFRNASLTIQIPEAFGFTSSNASITMDGQVTEAVNYGAEANANPFTLKNLNMGPASEVTISLESTPTPAGGTYRFKVYADADGTGTAWEVSDPANDDFEVVVPVYNFQLSINGQDPVGKETLQQAVYDASGSEPNRITILASNVGTEGGVEIDGKEITIVATTGYDLVTIDGEEKDERAFYIHNNASVTFKDLEIVNCHPSSGNGGAVSVDVSTLTVLNCRFDSNTTSGDYDGGAIEIISSNLSIDSSTFTANQAADTFNADGGGIYIDNDDAYKSIEITNSMFDSNAAGYRGGGIMVTSKNANNFVISNTMFVSNWVVPNEYYYFGGGLYLSDVSATNEFKIDSCEIKDNAAKMGGGIYTTNVENLLIDHSTISNNEADSDAGGVRIFDGSKVIITDSEISSNTALKAEGMETGNGGGIVVEAAYDTAFATIVNSTISLNTAKNGEGGGVYLNTELEHNTYASIDNSTFTSNEANNGGGIALESNNENATVTASIFNSTFEENNALTSGGGIYIASQASVTNEGGDEWLRVDYPDNAGETLSEIEKEDPATNEFTVNTSGTDDDDIDFSDYVYIP